MASPAYYDIEVQQNSTFDLNMEFMDDSDGMIDLSLYSVRFQVRPNAETDVKYLYADNTGATVGASAANGGIYLNINEEGTGQTGGMQVLVDAESMANVPIGSWLYSLEMSDGNTTEEILHGRFVVMPKVTI